MTREAVITGLGIVSPIGVGVEAFWQAACAGRSGIGRPTRFDASKLPPECQIVGEVRDFDPRQWMPSPAYKMAGRFSQFAVAAAKMAKEDSGLDTAEIPPERVRVAVGTAMNGVVDVGEPTFHLFLSGKEIWPWTCLEYPAHAATVHVGIATAMSGQTATFSTACAAGLDAISWAAIQVRQNKATAVIAGATEAPLSPYSLQLFRSVGVLSTWTGPPEEASRPFDRWRSGLVLSEGAAFVVVEDEQHAHARSAPIYARITGCASASEGRHLRKVDEAGDVASSVLTQSLHAARLQPSDVDYISAHGNSMQDYDIAETAAIKSALGRYAWNVPISSLKSMCGQALAAGSAMQVVLCCLALRDQVIPPTINYHFPDPACDLDYVPNVARRARLRTALVHAHSLGGSHTAMLLRSD